MENKFRFDADLIVSSLSASTKEEAIKTLAQKLVEKDFVSSLYYKNVIEREKVYPTGLKASGGVIAMPHAFDPSVKGTHVVIGITKNKIPFYNMENMDEELQVEIIFLLAINDAKKQIEMLKVLMKIFQSEKLLKVIKNLNKSIEICNELNSFLDLEGESL